MADRPLAEPQREPAAGDQGARRAHPAPRGRDRRPLRVGASPPPRERGREGVGRRPERVEDRLVADGAAAAAGEAVGRGLEHRRDQRRRRWPPTRPLGTRPRCRRCRRADRTRRRRPPRGGDRRPVAARRAACRRAARPSSSSTARKPIDEVVAVVAVAENRVEPGQRAAWRSTAASARRAGPQDRAASIACDGRSAAGAGARRGTAILGCSAVRAECRQRRASAATPAGLDRAPARRIHRALMMRFLLSS